MRSFLALGVLLIFCGGVVSAEEIAIKDCQVSFETVGEPVLVKIAGASKKECVGSLRVEGEAVVASAFKMDLNQIDTGIALRNRHLRENYLEVDQYPVATLTLTKLHQFVEQRAGRASDFSPMEAELELRGKKVMVEDGLYKLSKNQGVAKFSIHLPRWGIEMPSFMGVKVVDKIHVTVAFRF